MKRLKLKYQLIIYYAIIIVMVISAFLVYTLQKSDGNHEHYQYAILLLIIALIVFRLEYFPTLSN